MALGKLLFRAQDKDVRPEKEFLSGMPEVADALIPVAVLFMLGPSLQPSLDHRPLPPIPDRLRNSLHPEWRGRIKT